MTLLVGLGNPGPKYSGTRHNLGYRVIEALAHRLGASSPERRGVSICAPAVFKDKDLLLVQPLTYMNKSGRAVAELLSLEGTSLDRLLVIYDDLDLPPGAIRLKTKGGSGGHRGIQSVIDCLQSGDFARLRIGVGRPPARLDAAEYVLQPFTRGEDELIAMAVERAVEAALLFCADGAEKAMNFFNRSLPEEE